MKDVDAQIVIVDAARNSALPSIPGGRARASIRVHAHQWRRGAGPRKRGVHPTRRCPSDCAHSRAYGAPHIASTRALRVEGFSPRAASSTTRPCDRIRVARRSTSVVDSGAGKRTDGAALKYGPRSPAVLSSALLRRCKRCERTPTMRSTWRPIEGIGRRVAGRRSFRSPMRLPSAPTTRATLPHAEGRRSRPVGVIKRGHWVADSLAMYSRRRRHRVRYLGRPEWQGRGSRGPSPSGCDMTPLLVTPCFTTSQRDWNHESAPDSPVPHVSAYRRTRGLQPVAIRRA